MGKIIVIEGTDGSGKKTQAVKLFERLKREGYNVIQLSFPNYDSPSAAPVKMYLNGELGEHANDLDAYQSSVLFAVDRMCTMIGLRDFYNYGGIIILDRYVSSNMTHQAGKISDLIERDKYLEWLEKLEFDTLKLPRPDKVIFLDVPVEISKRLANQRGELKAGTKQDIHEKDKEHLLHAYDAGIYCAKKYNWNILSCVKNNEMMMPDEIHQKVYDSVKEIIEKVKKGN